MVSNVVRSGLLRKDFTETVAGYYFSDRDLVVEVTMDVGGGTRREDVLTSAGWSDPSAI